MEQLQEERKDKIAALRADVYSDVKVRRSLLSVTCERVVIYVHLFSLGFISDSALKK